QPPPPRALPCPSTARFRSPRRDHPGVTLPVRTLRGGAIRVCVLLAVLAGIGFLPWIAERDPALTVLRSRYPGREATPEALAAVRADLGLDAGPWPLLRDWFTGLAGGDAGASWVSGRPVAETVLPALGVSLTLMGAAMAVALAIAAAACAPALARAAEGKPTRPSGVAVAALSSVPEFLVATLGIAAFATW